MNRKLLDIITCPISYCIFKEPVITNTGITFEKSMLMKHLKNGSDCPISRKRIFWVTTNFSLKAVIENLLENGLITEDQLFKEQLDIDLFYQINKKKKTTMLLSLIREKSISLEEALNLAITNNLYKVFSLILEIGKNDFLKYIENKILLGENVYQIGILLNKTSFHRLLRINWMIALNIYNWFIFNENMRITYKHYNNKFKAFKKFVKKRKDKFEIISIFNEVNPEKSF